MSSRSSKRNSSSHSSSDDSPAHVTVKQEELVEEAESQTEPLWARLDSVGRPCSKRPLRQPGAPFTPSLVLA
ncbi:hypothetical protein Bca52824_026258 [Brassica carinata]|uniref:Uncharacterized protein n=1 Tax=Brassica carinata TaxID=52824 RepID=A0A8X7V7R1_BRACI|nr:hypothetical protein Bca52824_026258 [Brassica carinata]